MEKIVPTALECAYIAGFIDGEGSVMIHRAPAYPGRSPRYAVRLQIGNTDGDVIAWIQARLGGSIAVRAAGPEGVPEKGRYRRRALHHLVLITKCAVDALRLVLPYLRTKRAQAILAISFQEEFIGPVGRPPRHSPEKLAAMEAIKLQLRALNEGTG